jgi:hypothetical protein
MSGVELRFLEQGTVVAVGHEVAPDTTLRPFLIVRRHDGSSRTLVVADASGQGSGELHTTRADGAAPFDAIAALGALIERVDPDAATLEVVVYPPGELTRPLGNLRLQAIAGSARGALLVRS